MSAKEKIDAENYENICLSCKNDEIRDRSLFMAGGGTEEKCFSWQKFC